MHDHHDRRNRDYAHLIHPRANLNTKNVGSRGTLSALMRLCLRTTPTALAQIPRQSRSTAVTTTLIDPQIPPVATLPGSS